MTHRFALLLLLGCTAWSYVARDPTGLNLHRTDFSRIQFLVNQNVAAGLLTADGRTWITDDSDPLKAINAALGTWSAVGSSAVRFAPALTTSAGYNSADRQHVIVFSDTPDIRSVLGSAAAVTAFAYSPADGAIVDTDILVNPAYSFSTTFAENTLDLQSIVTHELGHALGANHTNVLGAAMFQAAIANNARESVLSADDIAFVSSLYPAAGGNGNATLSGKATLDDGSPIRGGFVTVVDSATGNTVSGMTSLTDGSFRFQTPPGDYVVYLEPLAGYVLPGNLYIPSAAAVTTNFQSAFLGGFDSPTIVALASGSAVNVDLKASVGSAAFRAPYLGIGTAAGSESAILYQGPFDVSSGQAVDLLICGEGVDPLTEQNLQILSGGITVRPGTIHRTSSTLNGFPVYRVTLDIAPARAHSLATVVLKKGSSLLTLTGLINVGPPQVVNAGSFVGGAISPGEVVSFFGLRVGPSTPVYGGFQANGTLSSSVGGVAITFDSVPAPLFYADQSQVNVQVPYEVAGKQFSRMTATYAGKITAEFSIPVQPSHPGICVVTNADGSLNSPQSPVPIGGMVVVWGTGAGVTSIPARTGTPSPPNSLVQTTVWIGGVETTPAYAGLTPNGIGLMQVNVVVPAGAATGNTVPLRVRVGDSETQTYISVR